MAPVKKHFRVYLLCGIVFLLALFFAWRFFAAKNASPPPRGANTPPVRVATVLVQNVPHFLNGLGTVMPSSDVLVQSRVDGQLLRLHFDEGQRVTAGDLLAEIDPRPFQASYDQAAGNYAKDKAQLENARSDLARYAKLAKGDFIAEQQYENQKALVRQYQGILEADQAAMDSARLQLEYSKITAPVSGRLGLRNVDEGNQIKANDSKGIVRITETSPCDVIFTLPENQVPLIASALHKRELDPSLPPLLAQAWDREDKELLANGELLSLDNQIDSATGTIKLKARFANRQHKLFPNQFVNIRLLVQTIDNALTVPAAAVQLGAKGFYCYVVSRGKKNDEEADIAHFRAVEPGIIADGVEVIKSGLAAGEQVVVDGLDRVKDNGRVRIAATMQTPQISASPAPLSSPDVASP